VNGGPGDRCGAVDRIGTGPRADAGIEVRVSGSEAEVRCALELRRVVFVAEQGVDAAEEVDGRDGEAVHLVALSGGSVIGTCRLLGGEEGRLKLGRMAVATSERRRGVATAMLRAAEIHGRASGARTIVLHAQTYACALYRAAGYRVVGEAFLEAGVEHVKMELEL
jgi:predicted GNAT family N-acyltransferase